MLFNSISFMCFFPIVVLCFFVMPYKFRKVWLLIVSYYFYMCWNPQYALLMVFSTLTTWISALVIEKNNKDEGRSWLGNKTVLVLCLIANLGILVFFKYFDFIMPIGISFYTFQALGYLIDVYRRRVRAEKNILTYGLFVSFFPQVASGPIGRAGRLIPQLERLTRKRKISYDRITSGLIYMLYGYFLKMVVSDRIAILVDNVFSEYALYGGVELLVAAVGYSLQIYCDFSSYSIIAIGAAQVIGIRLMENFDAPYFAQSIKEFWRRWHISLSSWFRDYLYISLGGNRCSKLKRRINLMITFLLSGLWHGANWNFIFWGGLHGFYQIIGEVTQPLRDKVYPMIGIKMNSISHKLGKILTTFLLTTTAWIFFRANSVSDAIDYIGGIFLRWNPYAIWDKTLYSIGLSNYEWNVLLIGIMVLLLVDLLKYRKNMRIDVFLNEQGALFKGICIIGMVMAIFVFGIYGGGYDAKQFIYFQF